MRYDPRLSGTLAELLAETGDYSETKEWGAIVYNPSPDKRYWRLADHAVSCATGTHISLSKRGRAASMLDSGEPV